MLTIFGIVAVFSVSIYESFSVTLKQKTVDMQTLIDYKNQYESRISGETLLYNTNTVLGPEYKKITKDIIQQYKTLLSLFTPRATQKQKEELKILQHLYTLSFSGLYTTPGPEITLTQDNLQEQKKFINAFVAFVEKYQYELNALQRNLGPSNYFYFKKQLKNILYALVVGIFVFLVPIHFYKKDIFSLVLGIGVFLLQLCVFVPGLGARYHGALGWIDIPGLPSIQPVEFFKLGYVIFIAGWYMRKQKMIKDRKFWIYFSIFHIGIFGIFFFIPDFGSILVMGVTAMIIAWYAGAKIKHILIVVSVGILSGTIALFTLIWLFPNKFSYLAKRFDYFTAEKTIEKKDVNRGIGRQNYQALIAIGGGGFFGQGYGKGLQKFGYIPEAQSDFIFAAFSEEVGFVGNIILLTLYAGIVYSFLGGIVGYKDMHLKLLGIGILSLIFVQMFVNIGVNTRILPNTGLTLPFISYGGSAIMANIIEIIILYKILQTAKRNEQLVNDYHRQIS